MTYERKLYVALRQKNKIKINKIIEQIYHSYGKSVGFIISKYVEDCNVVLKLTNDVFYNFSKVLNSVKIDNINYYLTIQAKRTVIDYLNSVKNFKIVYQDEYFTQKELIVDGILSDFINEFKESLTEFEIDIILLHDLYCYSFSELAEKYKKSIITIYRTYHSSLKKVCAQKNCNLINDSSLITLNYDLIRDDINANIDSFSFNMKNHFVNHLVIKLTLYSLFLCLFTVILTVEIMNKTPGKTTEPSEETEDIKTLVENFKTVSVSPSKLPESQLKEMFDVFVAFGPSERMSFTKDIILKSNLITAEDKVELKKYLENAHTPGYHYDENFNIYMGIKDGEDVLIMHHLSYPFSMVVLKSNLEYSFDTIINDFEQIIGQELTQEYLMSSKYDSLGVQNNGINIHFIEVDGVYIPYYTLRLNDKIYVVNK